MQQGDDAQIAILAQQAVDALAGFDDDAEHSERYYLHKVMRAIDLSRMLSAAMQQLRREGELTELELMLARNEFAEMLEQFRRRLAAEIAARMGAAGIAHADVDIGAGLADRDMLQLSSLELNELRRVVQPLARQLAARISSHRRLRSTGRLDARRTVRRSLQAGGVPLDVVMRRRHPHRPELVLLCDVSGSVAEFAQFTFTLVHALHDELRRVRSFAFVDGIAEVTDLFETRAARDPRQPLRRTTRCAGRRRAQRLRPGLHTVRRLPPRRRRVVALHRDHLRRRPHQLSPRWCRGVAQRSPSRHGGCSG